MRLKYPRPGCKAGDFIITWLMGAWNCEAFTRREISPDRDLPLEAVQSGLETLLSHAELVQSNTALLYKMT